MMTLNSPVTVRSSSRLDHWH